MPDIDISKIREDNLPALDKIFYDRASHTAAVTDGLVMVLYDTDRHQVVEGLQFSEDIQPMREIWNRAMSAPFVSMPINLVVLKYLIDTLLSGYPDTEPTSAILTIAEATKQQIILIELNGGRVGVALNRRVLDNEEHWTPFENKNP